MAAASRNGEAAKAPAKKAPAKRAAAKKSPAKKAAASKASPAEASQDQAVAAKPPPARARAGSAAALPVRQDEDPWTTAELRAVRAELQAERERLQAEVSQAEADLTALLRDSGDGAGDDQADSGSKAFEREHEMTLAQHSRDNLEQIEHALHRIGDGSYGVCENCGEAIGKLRLQAFPRATLCLQCKARQERR